MDDILSVVELRKMSVCYRADIGSSALRSFCSSTKSQDKSRSFEGSRRLLDMELLPCDLMLVQINPNKYFGLTGMLEVDQHMSNNNGRA